MNFIYFFYSILLWCVTIDMKKKIILDNSCSTSSTYSKIRLALRLLFCPPIFVIWGDKPRERYSILDTCLWCSLHFFYVDFFSFFLSISSEDSFSAYSSVSSSFVTFLEVSHDFFLKVNRKNLEQFISKVENLDITRTMMNAISVCNVVGRILMRNLLPTDNSN